MKKSGKSTLAIDKAIQNFFNSRCDCENSPPMFCVLQDASAQDSYKSASIAVTRLRAEHGIIAEVITKPAGIFIYEIGASDNDENPDLEEGHYAEDDQDKCDDHGDDTCAIETLEVKAEGHVDDPSLAEMKKLLAEEPENLEDDDQDATDPTEGLDKIVVKPLGEEKPAGELIEIKDLPGISGKAKANKKNS